MSQTKEALVKVLGDIQSNRQNLARQIEQQKAQIAQMEAQLPNFDALIATIQVSISDPQVFAQVEVQAGMNAQVPLTAPEGQPAPGSTGSEGAAS